MAALIDTEMEQVLLGAALIGEENVPKLLGSVSRDDFSDTFHKAVYSAVEALQAQGRVVDLVTIRRALSIPSGDSRMGRLAGLVDGVPRATHVEEYGRQVKELAVRRRLVERGRKLSEEAASQDFSVMEVLSSCRQDLDLTETSLDVRDEASVEQAMSSALSELEAEPGSTCRYGMRVLDLLTGGPRPSDLIVVAARTSVGKSAFGLQIARLNAKDGKKVAIFSAEMSKSQVGSRLLAAEAFCDFARLRSGTCSLLEQESLEKAVETLKGLAITIYDQPSPTLAAVQAKAAKLHDEGGLDLAIVDYLQLIRGPKAENRQQEVGAVSRGLKTLARQLNIPIVAMAQLSRAVENRAGGEPRLADLRESGEIENDSDVVLLLWRSGGEKSGEVTVKIAKQRNGPTGACRMVLLRDVQRFEEIEKE